LTVLNKINTALSENIGEGALFFTFIGWQGCHLTLAKAVTEIHLAARSARCHNRGFVPATLTL
jgi:hypothetical protein